ncbi:GntR family transcriptional regulator [Advenella kashmirensis W13003]|uniref:GntR family transcriptional regulator n=1 Tax=Advenella kashmirensis W13003 TaxID=1424334 RepID=V8QWN7_9BURK|nr:GntR family transcriptional regulator [Advenella kashmirensis]ETF04356.1 GntR family transcriptional regulator [Advenella kashmirensis W13003]
MNHKKFFLPGTPLYFAIKQSLLAALASGEWVRGQAIPPENQLAEKFGVSIGTLRKAVDELVSEHILIRHQGRGTFVATHESDQHFFKFFRIQRRDGLKSYPVTRLLKFRRKKATREASERLQLPKDANVFHFFNLLSLNDDLVMVDEIQVPEMLFASLTEQNLSERSSTLYNFYQNNFGINIVETREKLSVCEADSAVAKWLDIAQAMPLLLIDRMAYTYQDRPVEWRQTRVNTSKYEYIAKE